MGTEDRHKIVGTMSISQLQHDLIKAGTMPGTLFGWLDYLKSKEGSRRLKELEIKNSKK